MKKKILALILSLCCILVGGCGNSSDTSSVSNNSVDIDYSAEVATLLDTVEKPEYKATECVVLPDYKSLTYDVNVVSPITEETVIEKINTTFVESSFMIYKEKGTDIIEEGDGIKCDITYNGDDSSVVTEWLLATDEAFGESYVDQVVGHKVGDNIKITDENGSDAYFNISILDVAIPEQATYDSIDDAYCVDFLGLTSKQELYDSTLDFLNYDYRNIDRNNILSTVVGDIVENSTITIPDGLVDYFFTDNYNYYAQGAIDSGMSMENFCRLQLGMDVTDFETQIQALSNANAEFTLVVEAIIEKEGIEINEEEFQNYIILMTEMGGYDSVDSFIADYPTGEEGLRYDYLCMEQFLNWVETNLSLNKTEVDLTISSEVQ